MLLLVVVIWGINFPIIKHAVSVMHPFVLNAFRFSFSLLFLGAMLIWRGRPSGTLAWSTIRPHARIVVLLGLLGYVVYQVLFILGIEHTTSGNSALIMASSPTWTAILSVSFDLESYRSGTWIGLMLALAGTVLVVLAGSASISVDPRYLIGNVLTLGAAVTWGAYTAFSRPVTRSVDPLALTFCGIVVAFPCILLLAFPFFEQIDWSSVTWGVWGAIIYSGGLSTGIAIVFWTQAVRHVGATHTAVFGNLVPIVALLGGVVLLNEAVTLFQVAGGACIVGGLLLMRRDRKRNG